MSVYTYLKTNKKPKLLLALLLSVFMGGVGLFASLADEVHEGDTLAFDTAVLLAINSKASPLFDAVFTAGTELGGAVAIAVVSVVLVGVLVRMRLYSRAVLAAVIIVGSTIANVLLKLLFERGRPELWQRLVQEQSFSFPSGHAMGSMALALTVVLVAWRTRWRWPVVAVATGYVILIGFSRLYLGVHYPTDILAGWLVSSLWVAGVVWVFYQHAIAKR